MNAGETIKAARIRKGLGLRNLALEVGISPTAMNFIEKGELRPGLDTARKLVTTLSMLEDEVALLVDEWGKEAKKTAEEWERLKGEAW